MLLQNRLYYLHANNYVNNMAYIYFKTGTYCYSIRIRKLKSTQYSIVVSMNKIIN